VQVHEPDEAKAILMLRSTVAAGDAPSGPAARRSGQRGGEAVASLHPARQLPDKAVALLDTACARVAVSQSAPPAQLEDCLRHLALDVEIEIAEREARVGRRRRARNGVTSQNVMRMKQTRSPDPALGRKRSLVQEIIRLRAAFWRAMEDSAGCAASWREQQQALNAVQGDEPLLFAAVDENVVAAVSDWTGIPLGRMVKNEIDAVLNRRHAEPARYRPASRSGSHCPRENLAGEARRSQQTGGRLYALRTVRRR
jgi:type VI secretion system protein VasG